MSETWVIELGTLTLRTLCLVASPLLLGALVMGVIVSIFQAVTQINEATLSFLPKMATILGLLSLLAPWMLDILSNFTKDMIGNLEQWIH